MSLLFALGLCATMIADDDALLTASDLARILRISTVALFTRISRNSDLPPSLRIGKSRRWRRTTVQEWLKAREGK